MSVAAKAGAAKPTAKVNAANCKILSADFTLEPFDLHRAARSFMDFALRNPALADLFRKSPDAAPPLTIIPRSAQ
jgi:hypothetical protein